MADKKPKGRDKPSVGSPKKRTKPRRRLNRRGLTAEQYYQAELKVFTEKRDQKLSDAEINLAQGLIGQDEHDNEVYNANIEFENKVNGAKGRRGMPSKKPKTVAEKKEGTVTDEDESWRDMLEKQTDQNYISLNLLAFSDLDGRPLPSRLKNILLVSNYKGNLLNKLTSSSRLQPLMNATPFELSQLTPYFRIFKKNSVGGVEEFEFMDHLKWSYKVGEEERILNSSMGQGVGFKSFDWETTGTNLFSAPRTLMATLNLHFQSISELARSARIDEDGTVNWKDLIVPNIESNSIPRGCPTGHPEVDDLLVKNLGYEQIKKWEQDPKTRPATDRKFALMVEVGWKYGLNSTLSPEFKTAVNQSRINLDLTLVNHKFSFRDTGQIDLQISYVARLENIMNDYSANLFNLDADGQNNQIQKELLELKEQIKAMQSSIDSPYGAFSCAENANLSTPQQNNLDKAATELQEKIDKLAEESEQLARRLKVSMYGKFTQHLVKTNQLLYVDVPEQLYAYGTLPLKGTGKVSCRTLGHTEGTIPGINLATAAPDVVAGISTRDKDAEEDKVDSTKILSSINPGFGTSVAKEEGNKRVPFFYLGTLIDFYAGTLPLHDANEVDRFEIVLGDMVFLDYKSIGENREDNVSLDSDEDDSSLSDEQRSAKAKENNRIADLARRRVISNASYRVRRNLAYIPISFEAYTQWFTDEVINNDASVFTFKNFVRSLTTKLLVGALQSASGGQISKDLQRALKERTQVKAGVVGGFNRHIKPKVMNVERVDPRNGESTFLISPTPIVPELVGSEDDNKQYFVLYVSRLPFASQEVNEAKNAEEGLYHLYIGADKGIVKTIDLEKEANNRIRDANIMRAYNVGGNGLGIIQEPYNASVKVFGSGFFQPGQYVYINPTNIGLGTSHERYSIARELGIGGFYLITKVSTTVSDGKLETNLRCIFQNYGYLPDPLLGSPVGQDPVVEIGDNTAANAAANAAANEVYVDDILEE